MGNRRVGISIDVDVKGENEVKGLNKELRDVGASGKAGAAGLETAAKSGTGLSSSVKGLVAGGLLAAAGAGLVSFGKTAINAASDVEEMQSKFNTVFKDLATDVTAELGAFADAANRSIYDLQGFAATLQDTFVPLGFARDSAADMSIQLVKLAEDLASFNNLDSAMVVEDLQSALVGNTETLRKYGVVATQAAIDQEALALGLEFTKGQMDAQTKAAAILSITMKSTSDAQGDAIRTSDSYANQLKGLQAAQQELNVELGQVFLPIAGQVVSALTDFAKGGAEGMRAITSMTGAANQLAAEQLEAATATQNWNEYGRKLTQTLTENTDLAFMLFGGTAKVSGEMEKVAAAAGDFSGSNEDLAKSLEDVFGAEVKIVGQLVNVEGRTISNVSALRSMNAELVTNQNATARASYETAMLGRGMSGLAASMEEATAATKNLITADLDGVDAAMMYGQANATTSAQIFQSTKAENERQSALEASTKAMEEAAAAEAAITRQTATFFNSLDTATLKEYQSILGATTTTSVQVAGRTEEQEAALVKLQEQYSKAQTAISDYQYGVQGLGLTEEERNEKIAEQQALLGQLQGAMAPLVAIQSEYATVTSGGAINQELLNQKIFEGIQANSDSAAAIAIAGGALGIYTEQEAEARLQSALLDEQIRRQIAAWDGTAAGIDNVKQNIMGYINELNNIPSEVNTNVNTHYSETGAVGGSRAGAGAGVGSMPNQAFASGVSDFVVPPGYPNDSYMVGLTSGETVNVTPAGQTTNNNVGGMVFNVYTTGGNAQRDVQAGVGAALRELGIKGF